ncbi:MAG: hemerythrin domain-containing protein [Magnetococcales bacterium]|nr:hemerythrin domain-containing protein [Magnetococcales bacterium]
MSTILVDVLKAQHLEIRGVVASADPLLDSSPDDQEAMDTLREVMNQLAILAASHFFQEELLLHSQLLNHPDPKVRESVTTTIQETTAIGEEVEGCLRDWNTIRTSPEENAAILQRIRAALQALDQRINVEENHLFPKLMDLEP